MADTTELTTNIRPAVPGSLTWNCDDACASLDAVLKYVEAEAQRAIDWYWKNKRWKAILSRLIQALAVLLAALAGLVPILAQVFQTQVANSGLAASLLVGATAAVVGMDKAFGFSSGWTRYVLTATSIRKALEEFRLDWTALAASACPCPNPPPEQVAKMIQRAKEFSSTIEGMVLQETRDWVTEFQASISQLEKDAKTQMEKDRQGQAAASATGSLELTVVNADKTDGFTFQALLEGAQGKVREATVSNTAKWIEINVPQGQYKLSVTARKGGLTVKDSAVVIVLPNEVAKPSATLPA